MSTGADLRQKASSATLPDRPPLPSLLLLPLSSPPLSPPSLFPPSPPLEVGPPQSLGERCKLLSGVWGGAPVEIEFGAF